MQSTKPTYTIGIPIYDGVDLTDVAAPYEVFHWLRENWTEKKVELLLIAQRRRKVCSLKTFPIKPDLPFRRIKKLDLLWVPGSRPEDLKRMMSNQPYLNFLKRIAPTCEYVCSVCEGALLLAAAGLLDGYEATTHWAFVKCLEAFPKVIVDKDRSKRFVIDRNRITGAGISSGFDEALKIVEILAGTKMAENVQITTQYFPDPPVNATLPAEAPECPLDAL